MGAYVGGQREALIGGALFEGLAADRDEAIARFADGSIEIGACHDYNAVGSLAGIYTASMPVFVVENRTHGNVGFCNFYEGKEPRRLNYGCYDEASTNGSSTSIRFSRPSSVRRSAAAAASRSNR